MSLSADDLEPLFQRARQGNDEALGELLAAYRERLKGAANQSLSPELRRRIDGSDIVQHACLLAFRDFPNFAGDDLQAFAAWLNTIQEHALLNMVRDHRQADKRDIAREAYESNGLSRLAASVSSPSQKAMRDETHGELYAKLRLLPVAERTAVELRYLEEAPLAEIARALGRTESAAASLLKRGLSRLKRLHEPP